TRERFNARFALHPRVAEQLTRLSLLPEEHVDPAALLEPQEDDYILVFGNELDHKDVRRTLQVLVDAFPFTPVVAFGISSAAMPNVRVLPSGQTSRVELHRLIASARVIVY